MSHKFDPILILLATKIVGLRIMLNLLMILKRIQNSVSDDLAWQASLKAKLNFHKAFLCRWLIYNSS